MSVTELVAEGGLNVEEAARFLGVKRTTLYGLMTDGSLPWSRIGGRRVVPVAGLKKLLADGLVGATTEQSNG